MRDPSPRRMAAPAVDLNAATGGGVGGAEPEECSGLRDLGGPRRGCPGHWLSFARRTRPDEGAAAVTRSCSPAAWASRRQRRSRHRRRIGWSYRHGSAHRPRQWPGPPRTQRRRPAAPGHGRASPAPRPRPHRSVRPCFVCSGRVVIVVGDHHGRRGPAARPVGIVSRYGVAAAAASDGSPKRGDHDNGKGARIGSHGR